MINVSGVFPHLAVKAGHHPARTETGIGALMPWANRLWFVTYVAHTKRTGSGTGLFSIDDSMNITKHPASVVGTYANRMIHHASNQLSIGPYFIDTEGNVRLIKELVDTRLTATCQHLTDPDNMVYILGMEGEFFEVNVHSLQIRLIANLLKDLEVGANCRPHFKDAYSDHGRVVVANNSYYAPDFDRGFSDGRLAEWDGKKWTVLERTQFNTVAGRRAGDLGHGIYAVGQDRASAILKLFLPETGWQTYRLPKSTHTQDHAWTTEWPRIREVESERWLMDASGMIYELPSMTYGNRIWGLRPICSHLRIIGDYTAWNGMLVMAGDQTTPIHDSNAYVGQPQANLWFGKTDDLWNWGKPQGWGGVWFKQAVKAGQPSDSYLMTGFANKCIHISNESAGTVNFTVEVDFLGDGTWRPYGTYKVAGNGYTHHEFAAGFSAHWVRVTADKDCTATAWFVYT